MFFVVGLGNPGAKYARTRHNVGFEAVELLRERHGLAPFAERKKCLVSRGRLDANDVMLALPQTYMNLSGDAVAPLVRFYKGEPSRLVVVHDELDFDPGRVGVKTGGGHGGHNGLRSIINHLGRDFVRVRIGVGKPPDPRRGADFVLSRFTPQERQQVDEALHTAADAVLSVVQLGPAEAMSRFNRRG